MSEEKITERENKRDKWKEKKRERENKNGKTERDIGKLFPISLFHSDESETAKELRNTRFDEKTN